MTTHPLTQAHERGHEALNRLLADESLGKRDLAWLSRQTGWSLSHLYRVSIGERLISDALAAKLATLFDVDPSVFCEPNGGEAA